MPNRIIREGINSSPKINALSMGAEILYRRLMSVVDDFGRYHGSVVTIRAACWPTNPEKIREKDVDKWLTELIKGDDVLIKLYNVHGAVYLELQNFRQVTRSKSKFPDPPWVKSARNVKATCEQPASNPPADCAQTDCTSRMRSAETEAETEAVVSAPGGDAPDIASSSESVIPFSAPVTFDSDRQALWVWFVSEFPGELRSDWDCRIFMGVIQTFDDILLLRKNLPLWKASEKWRGGFIHSAENFLKKRIFRSQPREPPVRKAAGRHSFIDDVTEVIGKNLAEGREPLA